MIRNRYAVTAKVPGGGTHDEFLAPTCGGFERYTLV
jgi:hypothetical protein